MAGLGLLVAGVAHEINSPSAAIRGSVDGLGIRARRVARHERGDRERHAGLAADRGHPRAARAAPRRAPARHRPAPRASARQGARGGDRSDRGRRARRSRRDRRRRARAGRRRWAAARTLAPRVVAALTEYVYLHRTTSTVRHAIGQIQRIVGALKSYSHLDQQATRTEADLHEGIETTLALLHHALRDIVVERKYGTLPRVPVYVDELNQVWTNLIQNARAGPGRQGRDRDRDASSTAPTARSCASSTTVRASRPTSCRASSSRSSRPSPRARAPASDSASCRQIVEKHGGDLRCESRRGSHLLRGPPRRSRWAAA